MSNIILQVGVKILLKNKHGKYLLLRRSLAKYPDVARRWDVAGGRIDPGTTLRENLKREVKEETGLDYVGEPELVAAQDILRSSDVHVVRLTYRGKIDGDVSLGEEENDMYAWYSSEELEKLEGLDRYVRELIDSGKLWS